MNEQQRQLVDDLFAELFDLSAPERLARLALVEDAAVRAELESLLQHAGERTQDLGAAIGGLMQQASESGAFGGRTIGPGTRLGHYRIEGRLGQGGMGDVYEAVREDDFHKRVALKIVRAGFNSAYALKRFQQERQTLATLEHPNIARLIDGGEIEAGTPYLVLEFVEGVAIDEYCKDKPREDVLRLFLKVCDTVDYAHRNLIIHRDLKPANIMVTADGEPKLLDFGIAKLLDANAERTLTGFAALTPQYASPEQVRGGGVTTATDVYSLGLILYELLAGRRPYTISSTSAIEIDRLVCQIDPPRPNLGEDLDNILMMALRKEPERRYRSVREFAADLEKHLDGFPVSARPDTIRYRTAKFVGRNKAPVAAGALAMLGIVGAAGVAVWQAQVAKQQAAEAQRRFQQVRQLARTFIFDFDSKIRDLDGATPARQMIVTSALQYLNGIAAEGTANNDPGFLFELGKAYERIADIQGQPGFTNLGLTKDAAGNYRKAVDLQLRAALSPAVDRARTGEKPPGEWHRSVSWTYGTLGRALMVMRDFPEANKAVEKAVQLVETIPDTAELAYEKDRTRGSVYSSVFDVYMEQNRSQDALEALRRIPVDGPYMRTIPHRTVLFEKALIRMRLARPLIQLGRLDEAEAELKAALESRQMQSAAEPKNLFFARAVAATWARMALVEYSKEGPHRNNPRLAATYLQKADRIMEDLLSKDPANGQARREYVINLTELARTSGQFDTALAAKVIARARVENAKFPADSPAIAELGKHIEELSKKPVEQPEQQRK